MQELNSNKTQGSHLNIYNIIIYSYAHAKNIDKECFLPWPHVHNSYILYIYT